MSQAFKWGFDMRCWKKHLNPLTWPEILRQFALSAGCGPQLSKESEENANVPDKDEVTYFISFIIYSPPMMSTCKFMSLDTEWGLMHMQLTE